MRRPTSESPDTPAVQSAPVRVDGGDSVASCVIQRADLADCVELGQLTARLLMNNNWGTRPWLPPQG